MTEAAAIETPEIELFAVNRDDQPASFIFGSPRRYIQGPGVIELTGAYLAKLGFRSAAVLLSTRSQQAEGARLLKSLADEGIPAEIATFGGECSLEEIEKHTAAIRQLSQAPDTVIALGGGKVVDAGKCIAYRLGVPSVVVPSLASNDAPCSAASVVYTPEGATEAYELFEENPALVLVDTAVIAAAPARYLVAGMGDAMATWYEARACAQNPDSVNGFGARPTLAGTAIAELCARTVYDYGEAALASAANATVDTAMEKIVEANTLLSGVGFECGGLAASHAFAQAYTAIPHVHHQFLHGEMVAMGILAQLALEDWQDEAERATRFFAKVGLPVHLGQLDLAPDDEANLATVVAGALDFPFIGNMPCEVNEQRLHTALLSADALGRKVADEMGDAAYRALHG